MRFPAKAGSDSESGICYIITPIPAVTSSTQLEAIVYDLRFAWRGLRRDRAFTLTAIAMLTLAIALNVTVFAVMDTMLFRGLPLARRPDRLIYIQERRPAGGLISYADFEDWRTEAKSFEGLAFVGESFLSLKDGDGRPTDTNAFAVSANTFRFSAFGRCWGAILLQPMRSPARRWLRFSTIAFGRAALVAAPTSSACACT